MFDQIPQFAVICFVRTTPTRVNPVHIGSILFGQRTYTVASVLETAALLLRSEGVPQVGEVASWRGFWFGESAWIEDHEAVVGEERSGFILVAVDEAIVPFFSIGAMTANIAGDPVFADLLRSARTQLA